MDRSCRGVLEAGRALARRHYAASPYCTEVREGEPGGMSRARAHSGESMVFQKCLLPNCDECGGRLLVGEAVALGRKDGSKERKFRVETIRR